LALRCGVKASDINLEFRYKELLNDQKLEELKINQDEIIKMSQKLMLKIAVEKPYFVMTPGGYCIICKLKADATILDLKKKVCADYGRGDAYRPETGDFKIFMNQYGMNGDKIEGNWVELTNDKKVNQCFELGWVISYMIGLTTVTCDETTGIENIAYINDKERQVVGGFETQNQGTSHYAVPGTDWLLSLMPNSQKDGKLEPFYHRGLKQTDKKSLNHPHGWHKNYKPGKEMPNIKSKLKSICASSHLDQIYLLDENGDLWFKHGTRDPYWTWVRDNVDQVTVAPLGNMCAIIESSTKKIKLCPLPNGHFDIIAPLSPNTPVKAKWDHFEDYGIAKYSGETTGERGTVPLKSISIAYDCKTLIGVGPKVLESDNDCLNTIY
jgi:hypothetical protein